MWQSRFLLPTSCTLSEHRSEFQNAEYTYNHLIIKVSLFYIIVNQFSFIYVFIITGQMNSKNRTSVINSILKNETLISKNETVRKFCVRIKNRLWKHTKRLPFLLQNSRISSSLWHFTKWQKCRKYWLQAFLRDKKWTQLRYALYQNCGSYLE